MPTTDEDPANGERIHRTCTVETHRRVRTAGDLVHRLVVTDRNARTFVVLISGGHDSTVTVGETYRVEHLVWGSPVPEAGDAKECPECDGPSRPGCGADAVDRAVSRVATAFDPEEVGRGRPVEGLAVVDGDTNVEWLAIDGPADIGGPRHSDIVPPPAVPSYVCTDCGCGIADSLWDDVDENRGPRRIVDSVDPIHDDEDGP